jgi:hypothetical protein
MRQFNLRNSPTVHGQLLPLADGSSADRMIEGATDRLDTTEP